MTKYDVIIIGSGLGGLLCAFILAKNGKKVLVVEKHKQPGGCLQTFNRSGVKFDTGMHYIGSMDPGQIMHRFFNYFDLLDNVKLRKLDPDGYDVISLQGKKHRFAMGFENFIDALSSSFPEEHENIKKYIGKIRNIASESPLYNLREVEQNVFLNIESVKSGINEFIDSITSNITLRNVLAGNLPLYAGLSNITPLYIHALINNFYIQSAYRIQGGSDSIARSLVNSIENFGGKLMVGAEVVKIHCDYDKAVSVELDNGEILEGESFISNIHPQATIDKLDTHLIRRATRQRISELKNTISNFTVYIKFKPNTEKYLNYNYFNYESNDVWSCENYTDSDWPRNYLYMHQCPPENNNQEFAGSAVLIGYMHYRDVAKWADTTVGRRGADYNEFKEMKARNMLDSLEKSFPGIGQRIESYTCSTPLTYRDYTATKEGSMYGIVRDKNLPSQTIVSQRTRVPNLFLTGQNINSHGILGVTIGAIITCSEYLGINQIIKDIKNK
ncbi:MAG TPA: NAD(P)/FAD-dependent oxidoreductase [Bacteroidales bacterium]|nr:NAD(P)/FAD-dependent oxidoreductase [Bacteroidales bacterium]HQL69517.1 NAD(P)/FAD-dependent oxidoreductase [Bacteroidales bacterium]